MLPAADARHTKLTMLTPQERECLRLVAQQRSSKEIAQALGISKASVDTYCNRARAKLGVASRREAAQLVLEGSPAVTAPAFPPPLTAAAGPAVVTLLPPVSSLGPAARLTVILGGAVALALAFGMLLSGLQGLSDVIEALRGDRAAAASPSR
ncbi:helix-turn-helix domain-containing protein [Phenylobacterium sp. LjRoot219]|uniref:response regulator transcription factor n=1 Tax=Phenylobacterium sp. LjRoot219 TaxID=3342283 RepID=UPI003ECF0C75